jgi:hypothetical protein
MHATAYSAHDLYSIISEEIRNEYQHNITQQIYVSSRAWGVVKHVKDDTLAIIHNAVKSLPQDATGLDLSKVILGRLSELDTNPYDVGTTLLRADIEQLF